jgi:peptidoglycan/xylan/chitin deacetylase (PgdA/CDA1 family)
MLYLLFYPRSQWLVVNRSRVSCSDRPCVALTFDDGPSFRHTRRLLEILKNKGIKATFFVVGKRAEKESELLQRIREDGHLIANHTYSHPALFCFLTPRRLREEIEQGQDVIHRICGVRPLYFRSPVGLRHPLLELYLERAGLEYVSWRVRAFDTFVQKPEALRHRIIKKIAPGDIILLHDNNGPGVEVMLDMLPGLIDELRDRGFECVLA